MRGRRARLPVHAHQDANAVRLPHVRAPGARKRREAQASAAGCRGRAPAAWGRRVRPVLGCIASARTRRCRSKRMSVNVIIQSAGFDHPNFRTRPASHASKQYPNLKRKTSCVQLC